MSRVAVDIGGTFTDLVFIDDAGRARHAKTFTTPADLAEGILGGLQKLGVTLEQVDIFLHGTTIVLNSLLQRKVPVTGLLTTRGFRDVVELMRSNNLKLYDVQQDKPAPLVPRALRLELTERLDASGAVVVPVDEDEVRAHVVRLRDRGAQAIAVCLLHAYLDPRHERIVGALLAREFPDLHVSLSSDVVAEWREFERTSSTVLNVFAMPSIASYTREVSKRLGAAGLRVPVLIMQSNGGVMTMDDAVLRPIRTVLSGPVGGVIAAAQVARAIAAPQCVSLDMGGTSCDIGLILEGQPRMTAETAIDGWPLLGQMVDIKTIGAGGGSIIQIDATRVFKVGPESAGANPGPACYGRGGTRATITDANITLNRIDPDYFLGGTVKVDAALSRGVIAPVAEELGMAVEAVAAGAIEVVNTNMAQAIREVTVERGYDVREFTLIAFGGNGGLHASAIARELGMRRVVIPPVPGNVSAFGIVSADLRQDLVRMCVGPISSFSAEQLNTVATALRDEGIARLDAYGLDRGQIETIYTADLRYQGQMHTVNVPIEYPIVSVEQIARRFGETHQRVNGYVMESPVELLSLRLAATGRPDDRRGTGPGAASDEGRQPAAKAPRSVYFDEFESYVSTPVVNRRTLRPGTRLTGPVVIEEETATTLVLPGDAAQCDAAGNVVIEIGGAR
jgi:N-methylhydantoinase A